MAEKISIDRIEIADNLFWFRPDTEIGNQSSLVFASDTAAVIVDVNIDTVAPHLLEFIEERAGKDDLIYAVVSHHHGDHVQGLETFAGRAVAIVPEEQYDRLVSTSLTFPGSPPLAAAALPQVTFAESATLHIDRERIDILRPPNRAGHTDGDAVVYFRDENVIYAGDYYFTDRLPLIDFDGGGDIDGYLANLEWLAGSFPADAIIIPGHGLFAPAEQRLDTVADFSAWAVKIKKAVVTVDGYVAAGLTGDEAVANGLPAELKRMGEKPRYISEERWIRGIYQERMKRKKSGDK